MPTATTPAGIRRLPNGRYQVRFGGQSFGTYPTEAEAIVRRAQIDVDRQAGRRPRKTERHDPTLADAVQRHLARRERDCRNGQIAASTLRELRRCLDAWLPDTRATAYDVEGFAFAGERLSHLSVAAVAEWGAERHSAAPTQARNELFALKAVLRDAAAYGASFPLGLLHLSLKKPARRIGQALTQAELEHLAAAFPERLRTLPLVLGTLGLRIGEALTLTRDRVDLGRGIVTIPAELCKERRTKALPLLSEEWALLEEQLELIENSSYVWPRPRGGAWDHWAFHNKTWRPALELAAAAWREAAGDETGTPFDGLRIHDLRHTAATLLRKAGVPHELIAYRLGHNDSGYMVAKVYNHPDPEDLAADLRRIAGDGIRATLQARERGPQLVPLRVSKGRPPTTKSAPSSPRTEIATG